MYVDQLHFIIPLRSICCKNHFFIYWQKCSSVNIFNHKTILPEEYFFILWALNNCFAFMPEIIIINNIFLAAKDTIDHLSLYPFLKHICVHYELRYHGAYWCVWVLLISVQKEIRLSCDFHVFHISECIVEGNRLLCRRCLGFVHLWLLLL